MKIYIRALLCAIVIVLNSDAQYFRKMIISVPVADLREEPIANLSSLILPTSDLTNPLQITQILLGEYIVILGEYVDENLKKWLKVSAPQQEHYQSPRDITGWHGYFGWIQAGQAIEVQDFPINNMVVRSQLANVFDEYGDIIYTLSIGTRLYGVKVNDDMWKVILPDKRIAFIGDRDVFFIDLVLNQSTDTLRKSIVETALQFIESFYSWGGRSAQNNCVNISSVDCSALVNLSFLSHGLQIPRMSHEQFLRAAPIKFSKDLQPGDFVFFTSITKQLSRMDHVMMYIGNDLLLEATFADEHRVRIISFEERMGSPRSAMKSGDIAYDEFIVYFGSFFIDQSQLQELRNDALKSVY